MAPSPKELTTAEVESLKPKKLHERVAENTEQINLINTKLYTAETFLKRWWKWILAIFIILQAVFLLGVRFTTWDNDHVRQDKLNSEINRLDKRIDSLVRKK